MQKTLSSANGLLGDPVLREQFKRSMEQLPAVLGDTRNAIDHLDRGLSSLEVNLKNIEGVTKPLGRSGEAVVHRIDESTEKLDRLMDEMLRFSQDLNNPQGSLGQLVHDREFYQHLNHAARNIEELTRELRPILDDVRVLQRQDRAPPRGAGRPRGHPAEFGNEVRRAHGCAGGSG